MFHAADIEVRIRPKVPVVRLLRLLCESIDRFAWDDRIETLLGDDDDVTTVIVGAFLAHAEALQRAGFLQGYRRQEDALIGVRGRIRVGAQLSRRPGLPIPVEVEYDEFTTVIVENQLVAGAAACALRLGAVPADLRLRARRIAVALDGVTPIVPSDQPPSVTFTRLNERYRSVIALARLILRSASLDDLGGSTRAVGFLVDMNRVFEEAVGRRLALALERFRGTVSLQAVSWLDDEEKHLRVRPDVVWHEGSTDLAVIDLKYKSPVERGVPVGDVYQALAYAHRYRLADVHLVYAAPTPWPHVRVGDVSVHAHHVDLAADLEGQVASIAAAVGGHAPALTGAGPGTTPRCVAVEYLRERTPSGAGAVVADER